MSDRRNRHGHGPYGDRTVGVDGPVLELVAADKPRVGGIGAVAIRQARSVAVEGHGLDLGDSKGVAIGIGVVGEDVHLSLGVANDR